MYDEENMFNEDEALDDNTPLTTVYKHVIIYTGKFL